MAKTASLLPQDFAAGGALPDGEYTIKECGTVSDFNYGGKGPDTPAMRLLYTDGAGAEFEQHYSAGKPEFLKASADGKRFEHPSGEDAHINKSSNAAAWLASMLNAGFPAAKLSDGDVTAFVGTKVQLQNQAQPKRPGIKDSVEGKTIPLVVKVVSLPGEKKASAKTATKAAPAAVAAEDGALDAEAITAVQVALAEAGGTLTRVKLGTNVMLTLAKAKNPNMAAIKRLASDANWLTACAEEGGWGTDGETVTLGG